MNILDWILIAWVAGGVALFMWRGFLRQTLGVLILVLALWLGYAYGGLVGALFLSGYLEEGLLRDAIGGVAAFFIVILAGLIMVKLLVFSVHRLGMVGGLDRALGGVLGAALFVSVAWGALALARGFVPDLAERPWWGSSKLAPFLLERGDAFLAFWVEEEAPADGARPSSKGGGGQP